MKFLLGKSAQRLRLRAGAVLGFVFCAACGGGVAQAGLVEPWETFGPDTGGRNIQLVGARNYATDVLIFNGTGTSDEDARALIKIISEKGLTYRMVDSSQLNAMSLEELTGFGVILWPGGYAGQMTGSLDPETRERVREAVVLYGVNYVGFCAGAFMAVSPAPAGRGNPDWGLSLLSGEVLPYYYLEDQGIESSMVQVKLPNGTQRDLVWWGGPTFPRESKGAVARYSNGEAAIVEGWAGQGFVVLSAPHPEAPDSWRELLGLSDTDGSDWALAWDLIRAALSRNALPTR